jgi:hypothetical protein
MCSRPQVVQLKMRYGGKVERMERSDLKGKKEMERDKWREHLETGVS